jgi:hypothetical protein
LARNLAGDDTIEISHRGDFDCAAFENRLEAMAADPTDAEKSNSRSWGCLSQPQGSFGRSIEVATHSLLPCC